ncbi:hypothetical protein MYX76_16675 [Desulfobacterota bacterium AH_259_B03_O07]|nr:hypothetical protein [Desulfobacterota bacterium AH_259_B03_O07]
MKGNVRNIKKLVILALVAVLMYVGSGMVLAGQGGMATSDLLGSEVTIHGSRGHLITSGGDGFNAGFVGSATGEIEGVGDVTVFVSTSWDWGDDSQVYRATETTCCPELEVHRCALINHTGHKFTDAQSFTGEFTTTATVTITDENGDEIFGKIVGGTNCELYDASNAYTGVNEGLTSFEITGGTGEFASASGTGLIRSLFDNFIAPSGAFTLSEIFLHLDELDDEDGED